MRSILALCAAGALAVGCESSGTVRTAAPSPPVAPADTGLHGDTGPGPSTLPGRTDEGYTMSGFSFVDDHVAGMPQPGRWVALEDDLAFLRDEGITLLVSLTEVPVDAELAGEHGLDVLHLPIEDFHPPTPDQQLELVDALQGQLDAGARSGVHCTAGLGRTGTMLATWLVTRGLDGPAAIAEVRALRPGSIETAEQEQAVLTFAEGWSGR